MPVPVANLGSPVFVIGICGGTASGKTTVCDLIRGQLSDNRVCTISQDSFYRPLSEEEHDLALKGDYDFDHPLAFDYDLILSTLEAMSKMKEGEKVTIPVYDFVTHTRSTTEFREIGKSDVVIFEGILAFHDSRVRDAMHIKIFVDTDADLRLARRVKRDIAERGRSLESVLHQYQKFVKPAFDEFIYPSKKFANIIIPFKEQNPEGVDMIVQHIRAKLSMRDMRKLYPRLHCLRSTFQVRGLHTIIRDASTPRNDFVFYSDRLIRLVIEEALGLLSFEEKVVTTPTGDAYFGVKFQNNICGVSIVRAGESMEEALREVVSAVCIGKLVIERDDGDSTVELRYKKLPRDIASRSVLLMDPVLATGHTLEIAVDTLIEAGVAENQIIIVTVMACPEGINHITDRFPRVKIVTTEIERGLDESGRIALPGVGVFADRYFGTA
eukprot:TRINITY_DN1230_c0_g1_i3.p1 TRINITY_DN1230_c0_g1~~TRINITY_DN1230_c0_g1_i3.p1  ORF type:complete len:451 (+),score=104.54 TRINITY_DN1230_c0_g1_i3:34-1353(+)